MTLRKNRLIDHWQEAVIPESMKPVWEWECVKMARAAAEYQLRFYNEMMERKFDDNRSK